MGQRRLRFLTLAAVALGATGCGSGDGGQQQTTPSTDRETTVNTTTQVFSVPPLTTPNVGPRAPTPTPKPGLGDGNLAGPLVVGSCVRGTTQALPSLTTVPCALSANPAFRNYKVMAFAAASADCPAESDYFVERRGSSVVCLQSQ